MWKYGGYSTPFYFLFAVTVMTTILCCCFVPQCHYHLESDVPVSKGLSLLKAPRVSLLATIPALFTFVQGSFLAAYVAIFFKLTFGISDSLVGILMAINSVVYAIFTPLVGTIIDKLGFVRLTLIIGHNLRMIGFLLVAPSLLLGFKPLLSVSIVGLLALSTGFIGQFVPLYKYLLIQTKKSGFTTDFQTSSMVATLLSATQSVGSLFGALLGGQAIQATGYAASFNVFGLLAVVTISIIILDCIISKLCSSEDTEEALGERAPLVINEDNP